MNRGQLLRRLGGLVPWLLGFAGSGCGSNFDPPSLLSDLRVLAVVAEPADLVAGDSLTLRPALFVPPGDALAAQSFVFCPFSGGAAAGFACLEPRCEQQWPASADGSLQVAAANSWFGCLAEIASGAAAAQAALGPVTLSPTFRYRVESASGKSREAVCALPFYLGADSPARNRNPVIEAVLWDGVDALASPPVEPVRGGESKEVRVRIDEASLDSYLGAAGETKTEEPIVTFYATAGRFDNDLAAGGDVTVRWKAEKLEPAQAQVDFYVVVRDLRGGQAVAGPWSIPLVAD